MINPFIREDTYFKNGDTFKRRINGREVFGGLTRFLKFTWSKANFFYIFLLVFVIYYITTASYFNWNLFTNLFGSTTVTIGLIALGMGLVILLGEIDLSVGSMFAFVLGTAVLSYNFTFYTTDNTIISFIVAIIACVGVGFICGTVNGFFVGILKMPSFIVTLATMLMFRSLVQYFRNLNYTEDFVGGSILSVSGYTENSNNYFYELGHQTYQNIALATILFILIVIIVWMVTKYSKFGRKIYAVGSNTKAASLVGIKTGVLKMMVFSFAGVLVGIAAFLHLALRGNVDTSSTGSSYELYAIASVVLGGIAMSGGRGTIAGVFFGATAFQTLDKIISAMSSIDTILNDTIKGVILLVAIVLQVVKFSKQDFIYYLQKLNLVFVPNKDLLLESKYKTEVENIDKVYEKKINKINHNPSLSDEEVEARVFALLDQKEAKLATLKNKYDVLIEKAKVEAKVHQHDQEVKKEIATKKQEIYNQRNYDIYLLKNKYNDVKPLKGEYYTYKKQIEVEEAKFISAQKVEILKLQADMGMKTSDIEHLRKFTLSCIGSDVNEAKINKSHDALINKYNANQNKITAAIENENAKLESDLSKLESSSNAKIEKYAAIDEAKHDVYVARKEALKQRKEAKALKVKQTKDAKAEAKAIKEAKAKEIEDLKAKQEEALSKRLDTIIKKRNKK